MPSVDEGRGYIESDAFSADASVRDRAAKLYPPADAIARLFSGDRDAVRAAVSRAELVADLAPHGLDPVVALARLYDLDVDLGRAAAEFGLDRTAFAERLRSFDGAAADQVLALRLAQGLLLRSEAERLYVALRAGGGKTAPPLAAPAATAAADSARMPLALWTDHVRYKSGAILSVYATAAADCYLTLVSIEPGGGATVLFPNDFEQDNLLRAGSTLRVPPLNAEYQLRLRDRGTETFAATCDPHVKVPAGVEHDFERQRFTVLGNWRNFLRRRATQAAERAATPIPPPRANGRGKNGEAVPQARPEPENAKVPAAHAAVQIVIE
jgi:hypothetical protein